MPVKFSHLHVELLNGYRERKLKREREKGRIVENLLLHRREINQTQRTVNQVKFFSLVKLNGINDLSFSDT